MEFQEFAKQRKRMHDSQFSCKGCPLSVLKKENEYCPAACMLDPEQAESIVAKWAAENPEPVYPTWEEWQKEKFPDAARKAPCPRFYMDIECPETCSKCYSQPIPAHIAEKLGVKPKN